MKHLKETELLALAQKKQINKRGSAHLNLCPECQKKLAQTQRLVAQVQTELLLPANLSERVWHALPEPRKKTAMLWKPLALGTGIAALAGIVVFAALPGSPVHPTPSFAQVEKAMSAIKTATWTETRYRNKPDGTKETISQNEYTVQIHPARIMIRDKKDNSVVKIENEILLSCSIDSNQWSAMNSPWLSERKFHPEITQEDYIRKMVSFPKDLPMQPGEERKEGNITQKWTDWVSAQDGNLIRFTRQTLYRDAPNNVTQWGDSIAFNAEETAWVQPETCQIVRRSSRMSGIKNGKGIPTARIETVSDKFRYNVALPPKMFELPRPEAGKRFVFGENRRKKARFLPTDAEQASIAASFDRIAAAWSKKDTNAFLNAWDWESYVLLEGVKQRHRVTNPSEAIEQAKQRWRDIMLKGFPFSQMTREVRWTSINSRPTGTLVRKSESEPFPPQEGEPQNFNAFVTVHGTDASGKRVRGEISADFQKTPTGEFKLVGLEITPRR